MARRMTWMVALPAAKTLAVGGRGRPWAQALAAEPLLEEPRRRVLAALGDVAGSLDDEGWAQLVDAEGTVAAEARLRSAALGASRTRPAHARYRGPVAQRLDGAALTGGQLRRIVMVTAAAGMARAADPVPDGRLGIGKSLDGLGVLATFWRPHVEAWLEAHLSDGGVLWDLLGGEYARAVAVPPGRRRTGVRFDAGGRAAPSATAKQLRGLVARHLVTTAGEPGDPQSGLAAFEAEVAGQRWTFAGHDEDATVVVAGS